MIHLAQHNPEHDALFAPEERRFPAPRQRSLSEAHFWANLDEGTTCPCCGRYAKRYKRRIHAGMARVLVQLYHLTRTGSWADYRKACVVDGKIMGRDFTILRYWGLVEQLADGGPDLSGIPGEIAEGSGSGLWRITALGQQFVNGRCTVPRWVEVFNDQPGAMATEQITVQQALGKKFNYEELMQE